jgi:hypothetical protein
VYNASLRTAATAGVCALIIGLVLTVTIYSADSINSVSHILLVGTLTLLETWFTVSIAIFTYGLVALGQKYDNIYLQLLAWVSILIGILGGVQAIIGLYVGSFENQYFSWLINEFIPGILGLGIALALVPLFRRFPFVVASMIAFGVLSDVVGFALPPGPVGIVLQLIGYGLGVWLYLAAASE